MCDIPDANVSSRPFRPIGRPISCTRNRENHTMKLPRAHSHAPSKTLCNSIWKDGSPCQGDEHRKLDDFINWALLEDLTALTCGPELPRDPLIGQPITLITETAVHWSKIETVICIFICYHYL